MGDKQSKDEAPGIIDLASESRPPSIKDAKSPDYLARFELERTHASLVESGKRLTSAAGQTIVLMAVGSAIVFGAVEEDRLAVPLLTLSLERWAAAQALCVLTAASAYRVKALEVTQKLLRRKLRILLDEIECDRVSAWSIEYPSAHAYRLFLRYTDRGSATAYGYFLYIAYWFLWFIGPVVIWLGIAVRGGLSATVIVSGVATLSLLVAAWLSQRMSPRGLAKELISGLDFKWRTEW